MPANTPLPLHAALEEIHDRQQRVARWIHDELAGSVNALQLLMQLSGAEGPVKPQDVLSRLRQSLAQLEACLSPAALVHLGFGEAMSQLLRHRAVPAATASVSPEQPCGATAACLYRCAELAMARAASGQSLGWRLDRVAGSWQLQLGPLSASASAATDSGGPTVLWSPELLEAWVDSKGGELDWAGPTPWGMGLRVLLPAS